MLFRKCLISTVVLLFHSNLFDCHFISQRNATQERDARARVAIIAGSTEHLQKTSSIKIQVACDLLNGTYELRRDGSMFVSQIPVYFFQNNRKKHLTVQPSHVFIGRDINRNCDISFKVKDTSDVVLLSVICKKLAYDFHLTKKESQVYEGTVKIFKNAEEILIHDRATNSKGKRSITSHEHVNMDVKYLELFLIVDNALYTSLGMNASIQRSVEISQALDTIYRNFNMRIILVGIELWNEQNKISVTSDSESTLNSLLNYAKTHLVNADNIQLLSDQVFNHNTRGLAYVGTMCSTLYSGALISYQSQDSHYSTVTGIVAHELGHNFDMRHDDQSPIHCNCPDASGSCFMQSRITSPTPKLFSQCSLDALYTYVQESYAMCLLNKPSNLVSTAVCGNNILDEGEECDCGTPYFCTNPCCDPLTCKLQSDTECFQGACCHHCKFAPNSTICRVPGNPCDVADYCSGDSAGCTDVLVEDGTSCPNEGICMAGKCQSRDEQCKYLWGSSVSAAVDACYHGLNTRAQSYGNCGTKNSTSDVYEACEPQDTLCGALHCDNVTGFPIVGFSSSFVTVKIKSQGITHTCSVGYADFGRTIFHPGLVFDGTPCGTNKYCFNNTCVEKYFTSNCNETCAEHEVCTNFGTCVCHEELKGTSCNDTRKSSFIHIHYFRDRSNQDTSSFSNLVSSFYIKLLILVLFCCVINYS